MQPRNTSQALSPDDMQTILSVTRALAAPFDLATMLTAVTNAACKVLHAERASVWLHDESSGELILKVARDIRDVRLPIGVGLVGACARDQVPVNVPDCYADPRFDRDIDRLSGFHTRCSLALPLIDHLGTLVGVMQLLNKIGGTFDVSDESLATALAAQCAMALSRVRMTDALIEGQKLRRELELARTVQLSTLPSEMPIVAGYDMHATFLPASLTGGDTYDLAFCEQGLLVVLGDATGHGIAPALSVTQMHAMLRMALRLGANLEAAFWHVNDQLVATLDEGRFITAFFGLLDANTHRLQFISGGQGPILHYQAAVSRCVSYSANSFPMGAMPLTRSCPPVALALAPGDILALLTDGVFEYEDAKGSQFGQARVEQVLVSHHHESTEAISNHIMDALRHFAKGAPQEDDMTSVLLKRDAIG